MGFKLQALKLGVGLLLYVLDIVTDIYVVTKYYQEGETVWFSLTLACLIISSVIVNITAYHNRGEELGDCVYIVAFGGQMCVIVRYVEQFIILIKGSTDTDAAHKLDQIRYTEALSESAPQWCIQTYVMLRLWSFPWYAIASTIVSLLSVIWGFVSVRMSYIEIEGEDEHIRHPFVLAIVLFVSQLGFLISRLSLLAILAFDLTEHDLTEHKLTYAVASVFMIRLLILLSCGIVLVVWLFIGSEIDQIWSLTKIIFISFFDVTISQGQFEKRMVKFACFLYFLESVVGLISIWHIEFIKYIVPGSVLGGVGIGILFFGIYYKGRYDYVLRKRNDSDRQHDCGNSMEMGRHDPDRRTSASHVTPGNVTLDVGQNLVPETGTYPSHGPRMSSPYVARRVNILHVKKKVVEETRMYTPYDNQAFTGSRGDSVTQHVRHHQEYPSRQDNQPAAWHMSSENHAISHTSEQASRDSDSDIATKSHPTLSSAVTENPAEETWSAWSIKSFRWLFGSNDD